MEREDHGYKGYCQGRQESAATFQQVQSNEVRQIPLLLTNWSSRRIALRLFKSSDHDRLFGGQGDALAMGFDVVGFEEKHIEDGAALVAGRFRKLRQLVPELPSQYGEAETIANLLSYFSKKTTGAAAIEGSLLVGLLMGAALDSFKGKRSVYVPEWGNAALRHRSRQTYAQLYGHMSAQWAADGCVNHVMTVFANDEDPKEALFWEGFGMLVVDAMRDLNPVTGAAGDVEVRRASAEDRDLFIELSQGLLDHVAAAPTFRPSDEVRKQEYFDKLMGDEFWEIFLAFREGEGIAYLEIGPADPSACTIKDDEKTASITGAFTRASGRGDGVATALLNPALEWARRAGYERCAVDFESANIEATRFWLRHFKPICYSMIRTIDERAIQKNIYGDPSP
jgi:GNAT superfamily N-acetyltransferase